ncbi:MAG: hypothetical protein IPH10_04955 [bacterium]|nr:hypothetical protein [bacterium]
MNPPAPQGLVVATAGNDARLDWNPVEAATYQIWYTTDPQGAFATLAGVTADTFFFDTNAVTTDEQRFYIVKAVAE